MPSKDDLKKQIEKKTYQSIVVIYNIVWDFLIIGSMFICMWLLLQLAKLLNMESLYFFQIISQVSEIGYIVMYLVMTMWAIYVIYKVFKE